MCIKQLLINKADLVTGRNKYSGLPVGIGPEVATFSTINWLDQNTTEEFREDTTNYLFNNKTLKKIESVKVPEEWTRSSESITVDTVEDMDKLKKIISQLPKTSPDNWGILQILGAMNKYEKTT